MTPQQLWNVNSDVSWQWHLTHCGQYMQHNYYLHYLIDVIMKENPQIKSIVELGTAYGALTLTLGLWGVKLGIPVITVDINPAKITPIKKVFDKLDVLVLTADQFKQETIDSLQKFIGNQPTLFIADGAIKDWEVNTWAPLLPNGSIITGHDLDTELHIDKVKSITDKHCEEFHPELWRTLNVQFAMWKKVK